MIVKTNARKKKGFTLAEIVVSLGLFSIMLLTVAFMFTRLLGTSAKGSNLVVGAAVAEEVIEHVITNDLYTSLSLSGVQRQFATDDQNTTEFFYQVDSTELPRVPGTIGRSYHLKVAVWWWSDNANEARSGQGKLSYEVERIVAQ
jgi:prepilin-type N-terminal cleavage/methylation domain-containing protein